MNAAAMNLPTQLMLDALLLPLVLLAACVVRPLRERMLPWLAVAPLPALLAALAALWGDGEAGLAVQGGFYMLTLMLDVPGAVLLGAAALLWCAAGVSAATSLRGTPNRGRFATCWLMALAGCIGVFTAADMPLLYLMLALMTFGAAGLVFHDESPAARRAAGVYLGLALIGETLVLMAMVQLAPLTDGSLLIRDAAAALPAAPNRDWIVALLVAGFGLKAALFPLHVWMPLAYPAAPLPAAAVMSGAVVKASVVGLIGFLPVDVALGDWGNGMAVLGMFSALYGVAIGITQTQPRVILAYSSVSQMGFLVAVIGMGIANGVAATPLLAAFYAAHHVLMKGAMFLLLAVTAASGAARLRATWVLAALLAVGLAGLPLTGGAIAKLVVKEPIGSGWAEMLAYMSAVGTALLMLHFLRCLRQEVALQPVDALAQAHAGLRWPWWIAGLGALLGPWLMYLALPLGTVAHALEPKALWATTWPVLAGAALAWLLARPALRLPGIAPGDIAVAGPAITGIGDAIGAALARLDTAVRQWAVAGVALLALAVLFGVLLV